MKIKRRFRFTNPGDSYASYCHYNKRIIFYLPTWIPDKKYKDQWDEEFHILQMLIHSDLHEMLHHYIDCEFFFEGEYIYNSWKMWDKNKSNIENYNNFIKYRNATENIIESICNKVMDTWGKREIYEQLIIDSQHQICPKCGKKIHLVPFDDTKDLDVPTYAIEGVAERLDISTAISPNLYIFRYYCIDCAETELGISLRDNHPIYAS